MRNKPTLFLTTFVGFTILFTIVQRRFPMKHRKLLLHPLTTMSLTLTPFFKHAIVIHYIRPTIYHTCSPTGDTDPLEPLETEVW